jgi:hypothetical protein
MNRNFDKLGLVAIAVCGLVLCASSYASAAITIDGSFAPGEWAGSTIKNVTYNPMAPEGNFGVPTSETDSEPYDIYTKGDANYFYVGLKAVPNGNLAPGVFTNLYFDTNPPANNGSDLGFEVTNDRAFIPGVAGYSGSITAAGVLFSATTGTLTTPNTIEVAFPWSFFTGDPLGMGFPTATPGSTVTLRLSQTFGYSVAGGASYGNDRLGTLTVPTAAVPEAGSVLVWSLMALAIGGVAWLRSKKAVA